MCETIAITDITLCIIIPVCLVCTFGVVSCCTKEQYINESLTHVCDRQPINIEMIR
jgi:hypothetical protein